MDLVREKKPNFLFLVEAHCSKEKLESLKAQLGMCGLLAVDSIGRSGRLGLFWNLSSGVLVLGYSKSCVDVLVKMEGLGSWRITCFYGELDQNKREESWAALRQLKSVSTQPLICCGDFNDLRS